MTITWTASILDLEARRPYPRWIHGQHSLLMDAGQTPNAARLVSEMDDHLEAMAKKFGLDLTQMINVGTAEQPAGGPPA